MSILAEPFLPLSLTSSVCCECILTTHLACASRHHTLTTHQRVAPSFQTSSGHTLPLPERCCGASCFSVLPWAFLLRAGLYSSWTLPTWSWISGNCAATLG